MVVVMTSQARKEDVDRVIELIDKKGFKHHISKGKNRYIIGVIGDVETLDKEQFEAFNEVEKVLRVTHPFKLASRDFIPDSTVVGVGDIEVGGQRIIMMAGPCAVENSDMVNDIAQTVKKAGGHVLRGGAFKPRTSPYSFQGLGLEGLRYLAEAGKRAGLPVVSEVMSVEDVGIAEQYVDIFQIGARNVQNFPLLREVGKTRKPVMLKRGMMTCIEEWLMSAEYILAEGNPNIILCERGIRTFEKYTRNTLDLSAIPLVKRLSHLPVVVDPSHGTGHWRLVGPMTMAAIAAGADGLIIEVHPDPKNALSDGQQSLTFEKFCRLMENIGPIATAVGRSL
jgi:3-deoxy-7-phosphoheptulonate synthase